MAVAEFTIVMTIILLAVAEIVVYILPLIIIMIAAITKQI